MDVALAKVRGMAEPREKETDACSSRQNPDSKTPVSQLPQRPSHSCATDVGGWVQNVWNCVVLISPLNKATRAHIFGVWGSGGRFHLKKAHSPGNCLACVPADHPQSSFKDCLTRPSRHHALSESHSKPVGWVAVPVCCPSSGSAVSVDPELAKRSYGQLNTCRARGLSQGRRQDVLLCHYHGRSRASSLRNDLQNQHLSFLCLLVFRSTFRVWCYFMSL